MHALTALQFAKRPVIAFGAGVRDCADEAWAFAVKLGLPVVVTWGALDLFHGAIGAFGTHGIKAANLAVQNCDWFLSVGTRLDTKSTGWPPKLFAPLAKRWMVDIDQAEIDKFKSLGLEIEGYCLPAMPFLTQRIDLQTDFIPWIAQCATWKRDYPPGPGKPYDIMRELSNYLRPDDTVVSDTGSVIAWAMQALELPCRFIHAWNMTPMGYGLPAAIGAAFATGKRVILLAGDGGLSVNITEFATVAKHKLNIKTLLFNNRGHQMCRQTQRVWLDGNYAATGIEDLATPDFSAIAAAYDIGTYDLLVNLLAGDGPGFLEYDIDYNQDVSPQVKFGEPLADTLPR